MLEKFLKRSSWEDIIISLIFLLFGILLIARPESTLTIVTIILGIIFIVMGILKFIEYYKSSPKEEFLLTISIIEAIIGIVILFASDTIFAVIKVVIGLWIIVNGILDLQATLRWRQIKSAYWIIACILSIVMIIAGIVIIATDNLLVTTIGIVIVIYAVIDIIDRFIFMKKLDDFTKN